MLSMTYDDIFRKVGLLLAHYRQSTLPPTPQYFNSREALKEPRHIGAHGEGNERDDVKIHDKHEVSRAAQERIKYPSPYSVLDSSEGTRGLELANTRWFKRRALYDTLPRSFATFAKNAAVQTKLAALFPDDFQEYIDLKAGASITESDSSPQSDARSSYSDQGVSSIGSSKIGPAAGIRRSQLLLLPPAPSLEMLTEAAVLQRPAQRSLTMDVFICWNNENEINSRRRKARLRDRTESAYDLARYAITELLEAIVRDPAVVVKLRQNQRGLSKSFIDNEVGSSQEDIRRLRYLLAHARKFIAETSSLKANDVNEKAQFTVKSNESVSGSADPKSKDPELTQCNPALQQLLLERWSVDFYEGMHTHDSDSLNSNMTNTNNSGMTVLGSAVAKTNEIPMRLASVVRQVASSLAYRRCQRLKERSQKVIDRKVSAFAQRELSLSSLRESLPEAILSPKGEVSATLAQIDCKWLDILLSPNTESAADIILKKAIMRKRLDSSHPNPDTDMYSLPYRETLRNDWSLHKSIIQSIPFIRVALAASGPVRQSISSAQEEARALSHHLGNCSRSLDKKNDFKHLVSEEELFLTPYSEYSRKFENASRAATADASHDFISDSSLSEREIVAKVIDGSGTLSVYVADLESSKSQSSSIDEQQSMSNPEILLKQAEFQLRYHERLMEMLDADPMSLVLEALMRLLAPGTRIKDKRHQQIIFGPSSVLNLSPQIKGLNTQLQYPSIEDDGVRYIEPISLIENYDSKKQNGEIGFPPPVPVEVNQSQNNRTFATKTEEKLASSPSEIFREQHKMISFEDDTVHVGQLQQRILLQAQTQAQGQTNTLFNMSSEGQSQIEQGQNRPISNTRELSASHESLLVLNQDPSFQQVPTLLNNTPLFVPVSLSESFIPRSSGTQASFVTSEMGPNYFVERNMSVILDEKKDSSVDADRGQEYEVGSFEEEDDTWSKSSNEHTQISDSKLATIEDSLDASASAGVNALAQVLKILQQSDYAESDDEQC